MNLGGALLVWGTLGLTIAALTRSAGVAIGLGVGYVLLLEPVVGTALGDVANVLPATVLSALAAGGTAAVAYGDAVLLACAYVAVALIVTVVAVTRRDVTV